MKLAGRALLVVSALAAMLGGCHSGSVVRVLGGEERAGPFVAPDAYSAFARGAVAEREGRLDEAASAYAEALGTHDALVFARLGAVLCKQGRTDEARVQIARGYDADPRAAVVFRERARCAYMMKSYDEAAHAAEVAVQLDPDDREAVELRAEALGAGGHAREAATARDEIAAREPAGGDTAPTVAATDVARGTDLGPMLRERRGDLATVDEALARGALAEASERASRLRLGRSAFAARALAYGHVAYARDLARRVAAADPRDASARMVAAAAADLANDEADLARSLASSDPAAPPSDLARLLFAELLMRRQGSSAAAAALPAALLTERRDDPLEERVRQRLLAAMAPHAGGPRVADPR